MMKKAQTARDKKKSQTVSNKFGSILTLSLSILLPLSMLPSISPLFPPSLHSFPSPSILHSILPLSPSLSIPFSPPLHSSLPLSLYASPSFLPSLLSPTSICIRLILLLTMMMMMILRKIKGKEENKGN